MSLRKETRIEMYEKEGPFDPTTDLQRTREVHYRISICAECGKLEEHEITTYAF